MCEKRTNNGEKYIEIHIVTAQLVEHRTGVEEVTGSNPVEALIFFRLLLSNCLNWKIYCIDHSSLSLTNNGVHNFVQTPLKGLFSPRTCDSKLVMTDTA